MWFVTPQKQPPQQAYLFPKLQPASGKSSVIPVTDLLSKTDKLVTDQPEASTAAHWRLWLQKHNNSVSRACQSCGHSTPFTFTHIFSQVTLGLSITSPATKPVQCWQKGCNMTEDTQSDQHLYLTWLLPHTWSQPVTHSNISSPYSKLLHHLTVIKSCPHASGPMPKCSLELQRRTEAATG